MGLFSGRSAPPSQRAMTMPSSWAQIAPGATITDYASVDANGENALRSIAVGAAINLICSLGSSLPVNVYRGYGSQRQQLPLPANLKDPGNTGQGLGDYIAMMLQSWLYRGNLYGEATDFSAGGAVRRVQLFHPDDVYPIVSDGRVVWYVCGTPYERQDLFVHRRVNPVAGRLLGASPIERHAMQIGTSLAAGQFGAQFFEDGGHPAGLLTNSEASLDAEQTATIKARWMAIFRGTREPAVLGKGWDWKPIQISPNESQFLETQRFTEAQCARIFGPAMAETLGYETGGSMTYANVVDRRSDLLTFTLNQWLIQVEDFLTMLLPEPQYVKINRDALLQSTTLARYEAHELALSNRWRTVNEVRDIEDLPPVPWGDAPNDAAASAPQAERSLTVNMPPMRTTVDGRSFTNVAPPPPAQIHNNVTTPDVQVNLPEVSVTPEVKVDAPIHVDAPITVESPPTPEPSTTRKTIVRDDAGAIIGIEETRSE